jgi:hypothetical protein
MATVGLREHTRFCQIDGWTQLKSARGVGRDHLYFVKELADGRTLRTKVSHGSKKAEYSSHLWKQIWSEQLELASEDEFWAALKERRPATREAAVAIKQEEMPAWLAQRLIHSAGMRQDQLAGMSLAEAEQCWQDFQMKPQLEPLASLPAPAVAAESRELAVGY